MLNEAASQALLVEDEHAVRIATAQTLELGGFTVHACPSAEEARAWLTPDFPGVVVSDVRLPGRSGLELLQDARACDPELPVILLTGHGDVSMAVQAMRAGAYDFIEKPFAADGLMEAVRRAQDMRRLVLENRRLKLAWAAGSASPDVPPLIGHSAAIERVRALIRAVGPSDADVLINGQTGTGKEVVARHLHAASGRKGPFVAINCGALPESVFESEIFGHEAGAFTSAQKRRIGKLEHANGGTVFLDEIESMPLALQVKLLRVLQERRLERLGSNQPIAIDCRVVAASKADLLALSAQGAFREDLYYRIGVVGIDLPRMAERREDIPLLLGHFIEAAALRYRRPAAGWSAAQMAEWQARDWPGNVRELRNFADRLVLGVEQAAAADGAQQPLPQRVDAFERMLIAEALAASRGNVAASADALGIPRKTLYDKLRKYQLAAGRSPE